MKGGLHIGAPLGTPMANPMLSMLHALGHDGLESFGDSTGTFDLNDESAGDSPVPQQG